jgi:hypothetical protein
MNTICPDLLFGSGMTIVMWERERWRKPFDVLNNRKSGKQDYEVLG